MLLTVIGALKVILGSNITTEIQNLVALVCKILWFRWNLSIYVIHVISNFNTVFIHHIVLTDDFDFLLSGTLYYLNAIWLVKLSENAFIFTNILLSSWLFKGKVHFNWWMHSKACYYCEIQCAVTLYTPLLYENSETKIYGVYLRKLSVQFGFLSGLVFYVVIGGFLIGMEHKMWTRYLSVAYKAS
jgi:hypothetical protein